MGMDGNFVWERTYTSGVFSNWKIGEPDMDRDCAVMERGGSGEWTAVDCSETYSFVCKTEGESKSAGHLPTV